MKAKYGFHAFVHGKTFSEKEIALAHLAPLYPIDRLRVKPVRPISHLASFSLTYSLLKSYSICLMPVGFPSAPASNHRPCTDIRASSLRKIPLPCRPRPDGTGLS